MLYTRTHTYTDIGTPPPHTTRWLPPKLYPQGTVGIPENVFTEAVAGATRKNVPLHWLRDFNLITEHSVKCHSDHVGKLLGGIWDVNT